MERRGTFSRFTDRHSGGIGYNPDALTAPIAAEVQKIPQIIAEEPQENTYNRRFTLEEARELILEALKDFDAELVEKAQEILQTAHYNKDSDARLEKEYILQPYDSEFSPPDNPFLKKEYQLNVSEGSRWNIQPVHPGRCQLMRSLPAESEQSDYEQKYFNPANPHPYAVIEFQYDYTIDSVVYMAHELGHAMADDYGSEAGHSYRENPLHVAEIQAYFVQHILYDYLKNHPDSDIAAAGRAQFDSTMTEALQALPENPAIENRPMSLFLALGLYGHLKDQESAEKRRGSENILGRHGSKNINRVLAEAGIKDPEEIKTFSQKTVFSSVENSGLRSPLNYSPQPPPSRPPPKP